MAFASLGAGPGEVEILDDDGTGTVSAPDGHGMILIERCVAYKEDATYRVTYAGLGP